MVEIYIQNGSNIYKPVVEEDVSLELERKGVPGKLNFSVIKDEPLDFQEGNPVKLITNGVNLFYGYVFTKKRSKGNTIQVTAYNQLRYLKNKYTYNFKSKTVDELIKLIADDFNLKTGSLENTSYKLSLLKDNKTLFDIIQNALEITLQNTKKMFVLYDDFGLLTLKNINNMRLNALIDASSAEDFDYNSSIDNTYNKIKLYRDNEKTGQRDVFIAKDSTRMNLWGTLQYFESVDEKENGQVKANSLLQLYNRKSRNLTIKNAKGDVRVIGGSVVPIQLHLGDIIIQNLMLVEKVKHTFKQDQHLMDLTLRGGEFIA